MLSTREAYLIVLKHCRFSLRGIIGRFVCIFRAADHEEHDAGSFFVQELSVNC